MVPGLNQVIYTFLQYKFEYIRQFVSWPKSWFFLLMLFSANKSWKMEQGVGYNGLKSIFWRKSLISVLKSTVDYDSCYNSLALSRGAIHGMTNKT